MTLRVREELCSILLMLQPAFFLAGLFGMLETEGNGSLPGVLLLGLLLGGLFLHALHRSHVKLGSGLLTFVFLLLPLLLSLSFFSRVVSSLFFWCMFLVVYILLGLLLLFLNNKIQKSDTVAALFLAGFAVAALFLYCVVNYALFSPDSYSFYEMSKTVFSDFGRVSTIRQYVLFTDYGISFPYFYPLLIAVTNFLTGFGMYSGVIVNLAAAIATLFFLLRLSKRLSGSYLPGSLVAVMIFLNSYYMQELLAARAVPLAIVCLLIIADRLVKMPACTKIDYLIAGIAAGAGMVIRFDFMVCAGFAGLLILLFSKRQRILKAFLYGLGALICMSPWLLYSILRFGKLWISDNGGTFLLTRPYIPQRFFLPSETVPDLFSNPSLWLEGLSNKCGNVLSSWGTCFVRSGGLVLLTAVLGIAIYAAIRKKGEGENNLVYKVALITFVYCLFKTIAYILVGYVDARYHVEGMVLLLLSGACIGWQLLPKINLWRVISFLLTGVIVVTTLIPTLHPITSTPNTELFFGSPVILKLENGLGNLRYLETKEQKKKAWDAFLTTPVLNEKTAYGSNWVKSVEEILTDDMPREQVRIFFFPTTLPYDFGAFTGIKTFSYIYNINEERLTYLTLNYIQPTHIYAGPDHEKWLEVLRQYYDLTLISDAYPIYKVTPLEASSLSDSQEVS